MNARSVPIRVPIRRLQQHASRLISQVQAGERIEITRNGRLVAVLTPPDPEQQVLQELAAAGLVDLEQAASAHGLADWEPLPERPDIPSLSEALLRMRAEDDR